MKTFPTFLTLFFGSLSFAQGAVTSPDDPRVGTPPSPVAPELWWVDEKEKDGDEEFWAARQRLYAQDFVGAERAFRRLVEDDPEHGPAWFFLGYTLHVLGRLEEALEVHVKAAEFETHRPAALYNAGCANALLGRHDDAFVWIERAFEAGFDNRELVSTDRDLDALRDDPRLAAFLPEPECAEAPFLGDVRVLYTLDGESSGDQFGWEGRNAGDCDRDGRPDVLISAPYNGLRGPNAGRIYVYSGVSGELLFARSGRSNERLGIGVGAAGDVDRDGHADVVAGAPNRRNRPGRAYVFSGRDGSVLRQFSAGEAGDSFGWKVVGVGDMDDDGHADVAVGAPGSDASGSDAGRVYVYSGREGALLFTVDGRSAGDALGGSIAGFTSGETKLLAVGAGNAGPGDRGRVTVFRVDGREVDALFEIEADASGRNLGHMFLSFVGDVDADGFPDVYASDWENDARGRSTGRVYVHSGRTGERVLTLTGEHAGDGFGIGTGAAGDVDGDGHADLIIGAWRSGKGAPKAGTCYLYSGCDGSLIERYVCSAPGDAFGFDAIGLGDLDGDGGSDFLITSAWSNANGKKSGRAYVIAGPRPSAGVTGKDGSPGDE